LANYADPGWVILWPDKGGSHLRRLDSSGNFIEEDARLIAEAGTVFHECGLSPRELLDKNQDYKAQNARLTVALRNLCKHFPTDADMAELGWEVEYVETACQAYDTARAVLATQKE